MNCKFVVNATALLVMSATSWAANDGAALYKQKCAGCHGAGGEGKPAIRAPALKGTTLDGEFAASLCSWPGRRVLADQRSFPKNNRTPISTLRSTLAWPARVGMRWPQVWHS